MSDYSKSIKRLLRELASDAYERELERELEKLESCFTEWRTGKIDSWELSHRIHLYETGASRDLYNKYNEGQNDFNVAYAIVTGILDEVDVPGRLIEAIQKHISFYESMKNSGE